MRAVHHRLRRHAASRWGLLIVGLALAVAAPRSAAAGVNVWTSHGPEGGWIRCFAIDPSASSTIWAGTWSGGIFKSLDRGVTWASAHNGILKSAVIHTIAVDPSDSHTVYAGADGVGLWKSVDGGQSWVDLPRLSPSVVSVTALVLHPTAPATMWAGTEGGLYRTTDGGATWTTSGYPTGSITALAMNPLSPDTLYAADAAGVYKTTNGGVFWAPADSGLNGAGVLRIAIDPATPSTLYATTANAVFKTTNGASTWSQVRSQPNAFDVAVDPSAPTTVYLTTQLGGIFRSLDAGATWGSLSTGLPSFTAVAPIVVDPADPLRLWAGLERGPGVYASSNGATWAASNTGLTATDMSRVVSLADSAGTLCAVNYDRGAFRSFDRGQTWIDSDNGGLTAMPVTSLAASPSAPQVVYAGISPGYPPNTNTRGVYRSTDSCGTWTRMTTSLIGVWAVHPTNPDVVYGTSSGTLVRSTDAGVTWSTMGSAPPAALTFTLQLAPGDPSTVWAGTLAGVFRSTDGGATWTSAGLSTQWIRAIAIHPTMPSTVYAGSKSNGGVFRSDNAGASWTPINTGLTGIGALGVNDLVIDAAAPNVLYVATNDVYKSTDGGTTWQPRDAGLLNTNIRNLAIDAGDRSVIYAATGNGGVFVLDQESTCGNGVVEADEACDDGNATGGDCCSATCSIEPAGTVCRSAAGTCDLAEQCTGTSPVCPADLRSAAECRPSAGPCDVAEQCTGLDDDCPLDTFVQAGTECRAAAGACDVAEQCTGTSAACPTDAKSTAECRASAGPCDVAERCDGIAADCPADTLATSATECRAAAGVCDVAEQCTGTNAACPADAKSTAECRPAAGVCDVAESCNGASNACPTDVFAPADSVCRASAGTCDAPETCTGSAAACPADGGLPDSDGDALCDAIDPCTNVGGSRTLGGTNPIPKIVVNRINTDTVPGNDHLTFTGAFILPASTDFSDLNPLAFGARFVLRNRFGGSELDVTLPSGAFTGAGTRGWKLTNQGKTWTYDDATAAPIGAIVTVNLWDRNAQIPNRVEIRVVGDDGTYPIVDGDEPIDGILTVGGPAQAAAGLCGETAFLPGDCFYNRAGNQLTCRP